MKFSKSFRRKALLRRTKKDVCNTNISIWKLFKVEYQYHLTEDNSLSVFIVRGKEKSLLFLDLILNVLIFA